MEEMAEQRFDALEEKSEDCDDCESYDDQEDDMSSIATPDMKKRKTIDPSLMGNHEEGMLEDSSLAIKH